MCRRYLNRFLGWSLPTKIGTIIGLISLLALIFFTPFFNGTSLWEKIVGPKIKIEATYPSNDQLIKINYKNVGGISLTNIDIRYSFGFDPDIFLSGKMAPNKQAELSTRYLTKGEEGFFLINMTALPDCVLAKEYPIIQIYYDDNSNCYYKWVSKFNDSICIPALINLLFSSREIPNGRTSEIYYPVAYPSHGFNIWAQDLSGNYKEFCTPYELINFTNISIHLIHVEELHSEFTETIVNGSFKLSKKYCREGIMPPRWCVDNNLD